ncbi:RUN domain-containing protein 3A [Biomphalaria glabrata]|nr:RUN domain-containing protein 3A-like [Biomphalaria glabrata]
MLSRRQINVQRQNLVAMCRISVKSLLDYACLYTHVDDDSEEFINFCAVFEQLVSHRLKPYQKKVWLPGNGTPRHFWNLLQENHNSSHGAIFQTCIPNIEAIETLKSPKAKLRAFIRVALMEKRLSDYMFWLLNNSRLIRDNYFDGAIMTSEEASVLCSDLIGLNAIDFNFCLKDNDNELTGPLEISYAPFIKYKQMSASKSVDDLEMERLSGKAADRDILPVSAVLTENGVNDILRLHALEKDFRSIKEQKDYLEELVRLRERQLAEVNLKHESSRIEREVREREMENEHKTMHACILELQAEMSKLRKQNENLKTQVQYLKSYKERMETMEVPMVDMASARSGQDKPGIMVEMDHIEHRLVDNSHVKSARRLIPSDQRSIQSSISDQLRLKEDSQSMIPLTGSLLEVNATITEPGSKENQILSTVQSSTNTVSFSSSSTTQLAAETHGQKFPEMLVTPEELSKMQKDTQMAIPFIVSPDDKTDAGMSEELSKMQKDTQIAIPLIVSPDDKTDAGMSAETANHEHSEQSDNDHNSNSTVFQSNLISYPSALQSEEVDVKERAPLELQPETQQISSGASSSTESEKEEEVMASDPEMVNNKSTSSSDVGDNTWDMMSDAEHDSRAVN